LLARKHPLDASASIDVIHLSGSVSRQQKKFVRDAKKGKKKVGPEVRETKNRASPGRHDS
jgi:hypothetical protein